MEPTHVPSASVGSSSEASLESAVMAVARGLRRGWAESIAHTGLAPHQARALRVIAKEGQIRPGVLAERLRVTPRSVTEVVDALIRQDLVSRELDPSDRRAMIIELTPAGHTMAGEISERRRAHTESVLGGALTADEERQLVALLHKLAERLA